MHHITIRKAQPDDLPILHEFEQNLINAERPLDPTFTPEIFHYYDLKKMIESDEAEVLVAEADAALVGSGNARIRIGEPYNQFEKYAFLGFMYCAPAYRGQGINRLIMDELFKWSKDQGLTEIRLQVYDENNPAVRAYEKVGFKKILTTMRMQLE
jgi:ribosomal protein S18 acetylase RimI-like enzyme